MRKLSLVALVLLSSLSGCSVIMAASPQDGPDEAIFRKGTPRAVVEQEIGRPLTAVREKKDWICTYQYFTEDEQSYGRAAAYAIADLLTLGITEIFTTPIEALQGRKHTAHVVYGPDQRLKQIRLNVLAAPLPKPEKALGLESSLQKSGPKL